MKGWRKRKKGIWGSVLNKYWAYMTNYPHYNILSADEEYQVASRAKNGDKKKRIHQIEQKAFCTLRNFLEDLYA